MAHLTYKQAAARVRRSRRTIRRWRLNGMPMSFDEHGRRVVREDVLLAWWRARLMADPVHQARLRRKAMQLAEQDDIEDAERPGHDDWKKD